MCRTKQSLLELEAGAECTDIPGKPMIRAWRPNLKDLKELFPQYKGDIFDSRGSFRFIHNWFEDERKESGGENIDSSSNVSFFFIGGDESGMCTGCCF